MMCVLCILYLRRYNILCILVPTHESYRRYVYTKNIMCTFREVPLDGTCVHDMKTYILFIYYMCTY